MVENQLIIKELEKRIESIKIELDDIEYNQVNHYYEVLQCGIDTRQEGLSWILRALWTLGEKVKISKLPKFLDSNAISFIFDYSRLNIILSENFDKSKNLLTEHKEIKSRSM